MVFNASFWEAGLVSSTIAPTPGGPRLGRGDPRHPSLLHDRRRQRRRGGQRARRRQLRLPRLHEAVPEPRARPRARVAAADQAEPGRAGAATDHSRARPVHQRHVRRSRARRPPTRRPSSARRPRLRPTSASCSSPAGGDSFRDCPHKVIYRAYALYTGDRRREPRVLRVRTDAQGAAAHAVLPPGRLAPSRRPTVEQPAEHLRPDRRSTVTASTTASCTCCRSRSSRRSHPRPGSSGSPRRRPRCRRRSTPSSPQRRPSSRRSSGIPRPGATASATAPAASGTEPATSSAT